MGTGGSWALGVGPSQLPSLLGVVGKSSGRPVREVVATLKADSNWNRLAQASVGSLKRVGVLALSGAEGGSTVRTIRPMPTSGSASPNCVSSEMFSDCTPSIC